MSVMTSGGGGSNIEMLIGTGVLQSPNIRYSLRGRSCGLEAESQGNHGYRLLSGIMKLDSTLSLGYVHA